MPSSTLNAANSVIVPLNLVVMRHGGRRTSLLKRQSRLRTVQSCTWLFSLLIKTNTCPGSDIYRPKMFSSFSTNFGSRETSKILTRCGSLTSASFCEMLDPDGLFARWPHIQNRPRIRLALAVPRPTRPARMFNASADAANFSMPATP